MKKVIIPIMLVCLLLSGCGVHWSYRTAIKAIDNEYFKTEVIHQDGECMIIKNKITDEYFLVVSDGYGLSITPVKIEAKEGYLMGEDANDNSSSPSMGYGAEGE
jgi:uncharacterized protein YceK